jgi:hypothetical protein
MIALTTPSRDCGDLAGARLSDSSVSQRNREVGLGIGRGDEPDGNPCQRRPPSSPAGSVLPGATGGARRRDRVGEPPGAAQPSAGHPTRGVLRRLLLRRSRAMRPVIRGTPADAIDQPNGPEFRPDLGRTVRGPVTGAAPADDPNRDCLGRIVLLMITSLRRGRRGRGGVPRLRGWVVCRRRGTA